MEVECQTDEVPIGVATDEVMQAAGVSAKEIKRAKRHLEKRLRETGSHTEMEIFRLLDYGAAHQVDLAAEAEAQWQEARDRLNAIMGRETIEQGIAILERLEAAICELRQDPAPPER